MTDLKNALSNFIGVVDDQTPMPFGKHKGAPMINVVQDYQYVNWLMLQPNVAQNFPQIIDYFKTGGLVKNECTPEHNAMQLRFLNDDVLFALGDVLDDAYELFEEDEVRFEVCGWDVVVEYRRRFTCDEGDTLYARVCVPIELKPLIGDDYPSILRTIKKRLSTLDHRRNINAGEALVICDNFKSQVASIEQVKEMFRRSNITLLLWSDFMGVEHV